MSVLKGIRVIEVSHYAYVPSAGATLADWGASVIKVEHPAHGDPMRGVTIGGVRPGLGGITFLWELTNRGKRSIAIDLSSPRGRELLRELCADADVFLTSFLPNVRARLGLSEQDIRAVNESIIYAAGTGQGQFGDERDVGGFDQTSFWYRSGIASALVAPGSLPPELPAAAFGDVTSGMALAGGIAAALVQRERTGRGCSVSGSLLATGMWAMQATVAVTGLLDCDEYRYPPREKTTNPLVNAYRTLDGRFIGLCVIQSDKHWDEFCSAIGRDDLRRDERFRDHVLREENATACVLALDQVFAERPLEEWIKVLSAQSAQWSVIQRVGELRSDGQVRVNDMLQTVDYGDGRKVDMVPSPVQHDGRSAALQRAPELGEHTEEVLLERGYSWAQLIELKDCHAIL
jgi:crotonobetainyl-CoA:carnitine CoA-transferase CaiB-like acyl-CoA transferase